MQRNNGIQGSSRPPCAVCKLRRRKCDENCILAPFFPAHRSRELQAAHNVFGISNMEKLIKGLDEKNRKNAADSLVWEAFCWQTDPLGPYGVYIKRWKELQLYKSGQCKQPQMPAMQVFGQDGMVYKPPSYGEYSEICDELKLYPSGQCPQPLMPAMQVFGQDGGMVCKSLPYGGYRNLYEEPKLYRSDLGQQQPMQGLEQYGFMYNSPSYGGSINLNEEPKLCISGQGQQQPMPELQGFGQDGCAYRPPSYGESINLNEEPKLCTSGQGQQQQMPAMQGFGQDGFVYAGSPSYGESINLNEEPKLCISGQGQQQQMPAMQGFGQDGFVYNSPSSSVGWNGDNGISNQGSFCNEVNINNRMNYNHNSMVNSRRYSCPLKKDEDDLFNLPLQQNSINDLNPQEYCLPGQFSPINDKRI